MQEKPVFYSFVIWPLTMLKNGTHHHELSISRFTTHERSPSLMSSKPNKPKQCTVEVRWGNFIENLTVIFLFLRAVINIPTQTIKIFWWLLFRKVIISQLELGQPVVRLTLRERWRRHEKRERASSSGLILCLFAGCFARRSCLICFFSFCEEHCGHFRKKCS